MTELHSPYGKTSHGVGLNSNLYLNTAPPESTGVGANLSAYRKVQRNANKFAPTRSDNFFGSFPYFSEIVQSVALYLRPTTPNHQHDKANHFIAVLIKPAVLQAHHAPVGLAA